MYGNESEIACAVIDPGFGLYACVGSDAGTGNVPDRAGKPLPFSNWFAPDRVAANVAVRSTLPPDASFVVAFHDLAPVSTHGGIVTGGPPCGVPPQRYRYSRFGVFDALPVPSGSLVRASDDFGKPTVWFVVDDAVILPAGTVVGDDARGAGGAAGSSDESHNADPMTNATNVASTSATAPSVARF